MIIVRSILLLAFLLGLFVQTVTAQSRSGFFLEPQTQAVWLLDEPALLAGLRLGQERRTGLSYDFGFDALIGSTTTDASGPYRGDYVRRLGHASFALRYNSTLSELLRYDLGASVAAGLADAESCGGTDVCTGGGLYLGAGPEGGLTLMVAHGLGVRISAGYSANAFVLGPSGSGLSLGFGVRLLP